MAEKKTLDLAPFQVDLLLVFWCFMYTTSSTIDSETKIAVSSYSERKSLYVTFCSFGSRIGLYQKCFFFFKKCFWHCSLSSQKMLKISRDSLKNAFSHFLSRLKIRSNKQMIKDQDTGMGGGGGACYPISGKGKRTRPYYTSNIKESEHTTTTTTLPALFSRT